MPEPRPLLAGILLLSAGALPLGAQFATLHARGTPTVDGVDGLGEWTGAATVTEFFTSGISGGSSEVTFALMNDDDYLYVSIRLPSDLVDEDDAIALNALSNLAAPCPPTPVLDQQIAGRDDSGSLHGDLYLPVTAPCSYGDGVEDVADGGTVDGFGVAGDEGSSTFLELAVPLDTADDEHDLSVTVTARLGVTLYAVSCDGANCGEPADPSRRVYLEAEGLLFFDDFEIGDYSLWSDAVPPLL